MSLNSDGPRLSALYIKLLKYFPLVSVTTTFSTNSSKYQNFCIIPTNNDEFENEIHSDNDNNYTKCLQILKYDSLPFLDTAKTYFCIISQQLLSQKGILIDEIKKSNSLQLRFLNVCIILLIVILILFKLHRKKRSTFDREHSFMIKNELKIAARRRAKSLLPNESNNNTGQRAESKTTATYCDELELVDKLPRRTLARDLHIEFERGALGRGRYGVVWVAKLNSTRVAVKSLLSMYESQWSREVRIYSTPMFAHANLLGFIGADILTLGCQINMLIVTEYQPMGSLYDYLHENTLLKRQAIRFLSSAASGLTHLHTEIPGVLRKPSIAHRDLKTKNILIKRDMECCLADFGVSLTDQDDELNDHDRFYHICHPVGSVRYMAPEILAYSNEQQQSTSRLRVSDYKCADVYAFGLVIWEVLSRVKLDDKFRIGEHKPPFHEIVSVEPSIELMRHIVCEKNLRPCLSTSLGLNQCEETAKVISIMRECWSEKANERLNALDLKKKLLNLISLDQS